MANLPTPKELAERQLSRARKAAFGPVLLAAMFRGQVNRKVRLAANLRRALVEFASEVAAHLAGSKPCPTSA